MKSICRRSFLSPRFWAFACAVAAGASVALPIRAEEIALQSKSLKLAWTRTEDGWKIAAIKVAEKNGWADLAQPSGAYTYLFATKPGRSLVPSDLSHGSRTFFPKTAKAKKANAVSFETSAPEADIMADWWIDEARPNEVRVRLTLTAKRGGFYSIATPTIAVIAPSDLGWGLIPGAWYGSELQKDRELALTYSQGIPDRPALSFERNTMTLCGILSTKAGITVAVTPEPGTGQDPWPSNKMDRQSSRVGISLMDRHFQLSPTAYSPVHGDVGSELKPGETYTYNFRYVIQAADWFRVFDTIAEGVYKFSNLLKLQVPEQSLSERVTRMQTFLSVEKTSKWRTLEFNGKTIGMYGSKTSDVGAMLMVAKASADKTLIEDRLPFIREFKLQQQQMKPGYFQYAAVGEYPVEPAAGVPGPGEFVSEVGSWVEPLYTTIYTLSDMGNMLLFNPGDTELRERIRLAAERLLAWQHSDGSFDVAYDSLNHNLVFPHLKDYRPTWYGLLIAHRLLGDAKYLAAAKKGADWFITEGVNKGYYLGACGDALNKWDFTTAQSAQTFLDLFDVTHEPRYRDAAVATAKAYATSVFTHPMPTEATKMVGGKARKDWEITQVGLGVEHIRGTAAGAGPIYLASHAGLFIRIYRITGEPLFLHMARAAARGRSAAADPETGEAIYYWRWLDETKTYASEFPWHAWWQIGWITDYLLAEAELRSDGHIRFPRGFVTPKVGPHESYGFKPGEINGLTADLWFPPALVKADNPSIEYVSARTRDQRKLLVVLLNQESSNQTAHVAIDAAKILPGKMVKITAVKLGNRTLNRGSGNDSTWAVSLPAWGCETLTVDYDL